MARIYFNRHLAPLAGKYPVVDRALRRIETSSVGAVMAVARALPIERASDLGFAVGKWAGPRTRKHRNVLNNLRMIFPDRDDAWIQQTAVAIWGQIGRVVAEYPHLPQMVRDRRLELDLRFDGDLLRRGPRGFVFAAMHQGNWNMPALGGIVGNFPLSVVYQEQHNKGLEALVAKWRNTIPCGFIPIEQTARRTVEELRAGRSVGLFVDHRIDSGELVPFAGIPAPTTTIPARMALKAGTGVIPARLERLPGVRFRLTAYPPIFIEEGQRDFRAAAFDVMAKVNEHFAAWIREKPEDWCAATKHRWTRPVMRATSTLRNAAGLA
ncbi:KDO2-lipid IV(A) lauroyltransferase [Arboricoccus pini]|uniref:KDO2-lipid IV(A) lauroyltransferase n=1 Tax=Arboricoccus pini TaxID=1963835 RepID=A0A212R0D7_9PROT|nr:hypothetical protein [Arboricoccus pini]SNB65267.1 KDO2-lipid IV(A) lauroyltransferase [Arboricoccus pini]